MEGFMINKLESSSLTYTSERGELALNFVRMEWFLRDWEQYFRGKVSFWGFNFFFFIQLHIVSFRLTRLFFSHHYKYPLFSEGCCSFVEDLIQKTNFNSQIWTWKANRRKTHTAAGRKRWIVLKLQSCANHENFSAKNNVEESQNLY